MKFATAASARLDYLYHYQRFDAERLKKLLATESVYCANPQAFNDPWDCRPWYCKGDLTDPAVRERHVKWFDHCARTQGGAGFDKEEHERRLGVLRKDPAFLSRLLDESSSGISEDIDRRYRVYCLSTIPTSTLMWSHYADNHQGICLEFSVKNEVFCAALKVDYRKKYPELDLDASADNMVLLDLLSKSDVWEYEDEYRLVAQEAEFANTSDTLVTKGNMLKLPSNSLRSIIVGCQVDDGRSSVIEGIVKSSGRRVVLKRAVRVPNHYKLNIS